MPTYKLASNIDNINGVFYKAGDLITLQDGAFRDKLLDDEVIYRHDILPRSPRTYPGGFILMPVNVITTPPPRGNLPSACYFMPGELQPRGYTLSGWNDFMHRYNTEPGQELSIIDEWALPDNLWPSAVGCWALFPEVFKPKRGFRRIT